MALPNSEKITSQIALLPDAALKQMAMMHKADPYILPLIISEDGRRKQMRQAAQAQMASMPQQKVADAALAQMGQLPEEQGIGALPAPNIQNMADGGIAGYGDDANEGMAAGGSMFDFAQRSEPVLRMAGGGMAGYMPGFRDTGAVNAAFEDALRTTMRYEGGYVENDAGRGPSKFGINKSANPDVDVKNLTKDQARELYKKRYWDAIGGDSLAAKDPALAKVAFDTAVNMGVNKAKQLVTESKGDPNAILAMRQEHYDKLIENDPKKFSPYKAGWQSRLADLATSVIPSAQAGEVPSKDLASQIPGQRMQAPPSDYEQKNTYFGRLADTMGIPPEYQRNISNTLNAMSGFTSPISTTSRAIGTASRELEATPAMIAKAQEAKRIAETERLLPPAKAGLASLDEAAQQTRAAAEAARRARGVEQDVEAARAAEKSIKAADLTSDAARAMEEAVAAGPNARAIESAQAANAARALSTGQLMDGGGEAPAASSTGINTSGADLSKFYDMGAAPEKAPKPSTVIEAAKEAVPAKDRKGFGDEDLLTLGLSLLANRSPNFMTALGEAGLQTLTAKKAREQRETDLEYKDIMKKYYGAQGAKFEAETKNLEAGTKYNAAARQHAMDNIQREMAKWETSMAGTTATPQEVEAKRLSLMKFYFPLAGLEVPSTMASTAPTSGFKVLGSRPQ